MSISTRQDLERLYRRSCLVQSSHYKAAPTLRPKWLQAVLGIAVVQFSFPHVLNILSGTPILSILQCHRQIHCQSRTWGPLPTRREGRKCKHAYFIGLSVLLQYSRITYKHGTPQSQSFRLPCSLTSLNPSPRQHLPCQERPQLKKSPKP